MKRLLLFAILFVTPFTQAQQTYVPDDAFEGFLESNGMGNGTPNDDYVTTANISGVTSLIVGGYSIADMTGIEDFVSLTTLYCFDNNLTALDVTNCPNLSDLRCYNNDILALDLSNCPFLGTLLCFNNSLTTLDVSSNTFLTDFSCYDNFLSSLDVTNNTQLSMLMCYDNQLTALDVSQNVNLLNFRCHENNLTSLDVSNCTSLMSLYCQDNDLTSLNVLNASQLTDLRCFNNNLGDLDLSDCASLDLLLCNDNQLSALDVSQNPLLANLFCGNNEMKCLRANNGMNINLDCINNDLECATVVNPFWTAANANYDVGVNFTSACFYSLDNDVTYDGTTLTADQNNATYQWLDCDDNYALIDVTTQTFTPQETGFYAVEITWEDPCGEVYVDTSSCHFHYVDNTSSIEELVNSNGAELVKIVDIMGRETVFQPNVTLIYIYSDGTMRRVYEVEE